jgi:hypothetical protein
MITVSAIADPAISATLQAVSRTFASFVVISLSCCWLAHRALLV